MLRNSPAECDFSFTATWLSVRLSPCESTVPEIVPVGGAASALCALALGMKLVIARFRIRMGRNFARCSCLSGFRGSYGISTYRPLLRLSLGGLCGWGEIIRLDAGRHTLQSLDGCGCGFASAAGAPFPLVANRRAPCNLLLRETSLSVSFCTLHTSCQEFLSLLRAVNACK